MNLRGKFMRTFVMFDLPVLTAADRREYRRFRKFLVKTGFVMLQESVYSKLSLNATAAGTVENIVKLNAEIKEIVAREAVLRAEIDKIIAEIEGEADG